MFHFLLLKKSMYYLLILILMNVQVAKKKVNKGYNIIKFQLPILCLYSMILTTYRIETFWMKKNVFGWNIIPTKDRFFDGDRSFIKQSMWIFCTTNNKVKNTPVDMQLLWAELGDIKWMNIREFSIGRSLVVVRNLGPFSVWQ